MKGLKYKVNSNMDRLYAHRKILTVVLVLNVVCFLFWKSGVTNKVYSAQARKIRTQRHVVPEVVAVGRRGRNWSGIPEIDRELTMFTADELNITKYEKTAKIQIPHIIHQTWINSVGGTYSVPSKFVPWIKSVIEAHPEWQYWFWTDSDVDCYFRTKHPDFYPVYKAYPVEIYRADVMRYFVLYDYGGFYLDLDVKVLKPLDVWTYITPSILSHESYTHTFLLHRKKRPNVCNGVMGTVPGHGYYKMLQDNLKQYWRKYFNDILYSTGPFYVDGLCRKYNDMPGTKPVTVIDPRYWFPTIDPGAVAVARSPRYCLNQTLLEQNVMVKWVCGKLKEDNFQNLPLPESFLHHHWVHSNMREAGYHNMTRVPLAEVIPNYVKVSEKLKLKC